MFHYESGSPKIAGTSSGITVELSSLEVDQWQEKDWRKIEEAERRALTNGLQQNKTEYFIKGAGDQMLDHGTIRSLQAKYPDVKAEGR